MLYQEPSCSLWRESSKHLISIEFTHRLISKFLRLCSSSKQYSTLQVLKIVYHRLITVHEYAYRLPCPDLDTLASSQPPVLDFIKLYSVILLCQAVWSVENSPYVRIIQGLDQKYQECLKEVIEEVSPVAVSGVICTLLTIPNPGSYQYT
jgi:hypothetical protein